MTRPSRGSPGKSPRCGLPDIGLVKARRRRSQGALGSALAPPMRQAQAAEGRQHQEARPGQGHRRRLGQGHRPGRGLAAFPVPTDALVRLAAWIAAARAPSTHVDEARDDGRGRAPWRPNSGPARTPAPGQRPSLQRPPPWRRSLGPPAAGQPRPAGARRRVQLTPSGAAQAATSRAPMHPVTALAASGTLPSAAWLTCIVPSGTRGPGNGTQGARRTRS